MFRATYQRSMFALISAALLMFALTASASDLKDPTEIIRSLAPIEYLPHHSGRRGPAIDLSIPFALDSAKLKPEGRVQLQALGEALASEKLKDQAIEIAGHTDASGQADYNRNLSQRRAQAAANFLIETFGFNNERFRVVGYGEDELKNPLQPRAAENRRVEISVIVANASPSLSAPAQRQISEASGFDLRTRPAAAAALRAKAERDGSVSVIVGLAARDAPFKDFREISESGGWQNLNNHIHGLQSRAMDRLGWVNFNDLIRFDYTPAMAMRVGAKQLDELLSSNAVMQVYEDTQNTFSLSRSGPLVGVQTGEQATRLGGGVSVAVIDSGVDGNHPFLHNKLIAEACFSGNYQDEQVRYISVCPSGEEVEIGVGAAQPCLKTKFMCGHGTHVAGIVAGAGDTFNGVAAAANIVAVQAFVIMEGSWCPAEEVCILVPASLIIRSLEWVFHNRDKYNIAAVNLSLGGGQFDGLCDDSPYRRIIAFFNMFGIAIVASSGNESFENSMAEPACLSGVVSVGATTYADTVAEFSNSSPYLDFLAPGATLLPIGRDRGILSSVPGGLFQRHEGTSMSAPHVAGAFAALKSAVPQASVNEMIEAMRQTGRSILDPRNGRSQPRIQVDTAITKLQQIVAARPVKAAPEPKPKPESKTSSKPKPQSIDGIRIENAEDALGEDGKIEW